MEIIKVQVRPRGKEEVSVSVTAWNSKRKYIVGNTPVMLKEKAAATIKHLLAEMERTDADVSLPEAVSDLPF